MTDKSARLQTVDLTLGYDGRRVVEELTLYIPDRGVSVIVGPNACGKSTLLRGLARLLRPSSGAVLLDGEEIHRKSTREVARVLGLLPQQPIAPEGISVADLVSRGRHPHHRFLRATTREDRDIVTEALLATDTLALAQRPVDELSGGQRQRVWIALALAQQTDLLLLDEPTTYLDLAHQLDMLDLIDQLNHSRGTTVVMVLHDLNLAARYAHHLIAMRDGDVVRCGRPEDVVTPATVAEVFGLPASVISDPISGTPLVVPADRRARRSAAVGTAEAASPPFSLPTKGSADDNNNRDHNNHHAGAVSAR